MRWLARSSRSRCWTPRSSLPRRRSNIYEMTRYGTLIAWAKELGHAECVPLLQRKSR